MALLWCMRGKVQTGRYRAGTAGAFAGLVLVAALVLGTGAACAAEPTEATAAGPAGQWATKEAFFSATGEQTEQVTQGVKGAGLKANTSAVSGNSGTTTGGGSSTTK